MNQCTYAECERSNYARGFCTMHYNRLRRSGQLPTRARRANHTGSERDGYVIVWLPHHPLANAAGYTYEHRAVLYAKVGAGPHTCAWCGTAVQWWTTTLRMGTELVTDHLNFDRSDNRPENLTTACRPCNSARQSRFS